MRWGHTHLWTFKIAQLCIPTSHIGLHYKGEYLERKRDTFVINTRFGLTGKLFYTLGSFLFLLHFFFLLLLPSPPLPSEETSDYITSISQRSISTGLLQCTAYEKPSFCVCHVFLFLARHSTLPSFCSSNARRPCSYPSFCIHGLSPLMGQQSAFLSHSFRRGDVREQNALEFQL